MPLSSVVPKLFWADPNFFEVHQTYLDIIKKQNLVVKNQNYLEQNKIFWSWTKYFLNRLGICFKNTNYKLYFQSTAVNSIRTLEL